MLVKYVLQQIFTNIATCKSKTAQPHSSVLALSVCGGWRSALGIVPKLSRVSHETWCPLLRLGWLAGKSWGSPSAEGQACTTMLDFQHVLWGSNSGPQFAQCAVYRASSSAHGFIVPLFWRSGSPKSRHQESCFPVGTLKAFLDFIF